MKLFLFYSFASFYAYSYILAEVIMKSPITWSILQKTYDVMSEPGMLESILSTHSR